MAYPTRDEVLAAILAPSTIWTRHTDIYHSDGMTLWMPNAPFVTGVINVDASRDERRTLDITLENIDGELNNYPGGFWYDKILKPYRGIILDDGREWEMQLGEFVVNDIQTPHFPEEVIVKGMDYTNKLKTSEFPAATQFNQGSKMIDVLRTIAVNGGVYKMILPSTDQKLGKDYLFEGGYKRWQAIHDIDIAYGFEEFFNNEGYLVVREFLDPTTSPTSFDLNAAGGSTGNVVTFNKKSSPARIYNHIIVTGNSSDAPPVWAEAKNENPDSPTSIQEIGDRPYRITSPFITTHEQAQDVADKHLALHALEQFEINAESLVIPWIEGNEIGKFIDPDPNPGDPDRYLIRSGNLPLELSALSVTGSRVTIVK